MITVQAGSSEGIYFNREFAGGFRESGGAGERVHGQGAAPVLAAQVGPPGTYPAAPQRMLHARAAPKPGVSTQPRRKLCVSRAVRLSTRP